MNRLHPTIMFNGHCKEALEFYKTCLNGDVTFMQTFAEAPFDIPDEYKSGIFNSGFQADKIYLEATDSFPPYEVTVGNNFSLFITISGDEPGDTIFADLSAGGGVINPFAEMNNGKFGMCADKYGIQWMVEWNPGTESTKRIHPYLIFSGECRDALTFYETCLDGKITFLHTAGDAPIDVPDEHKDRVFHSGFQAGNIFFQASDNLPSQELIVGSNFAQFIRFSDIAVEAVENTFAQLATDGNISFPFAETPDGGKFGMCTDKFGIQWMVSWSRQ